MDRRYFVSWTAVTAALAALRPKTAAAFLPAEAALRSGTSSDPMRIAVIGTGEIGSGFGRVWAGAGHTIVYGSRRPEDEEVQAVVHDTLGDASATTPAEAAAQADTVLLAVPASAIVEVAATLGNVDGKVIICPANGYYLAMRDGYPYPQCPPSIGETVQEAVPTAHVVVAFNSVRAEILQLPPVPGGARSEPFSRGRSSAMSFGPISVAICGNDDAAKLRVGGLVEDAGLVPMDCGPITVAGYVEGLTALFVAYRTRQNGGRYAETGPGFEWFMRPVPD